MSTTDMKAKLDSKVDRMRSQTMSFANEGMEISLNIPDTHDVKDTFGTVITTVVEQQDEIVGLHSNIRTVVEESVVAQNKILNWTKKCVEQLHDQNLQLQAKLQDAQLQIKNFAYNIQGFVDPGPETDFISPEFNLTDAIQDFPSSGAPNVVPVEDPALFRTEDGASTDVDYLTIQKEASKAISTKKRDKTKPDKQSKKTNEEKMAAKVMYFGVKPSLFPPSTRGRWVWAIKKVIAANRMKGVSMNKTRLAKNQTMAERISRIDADLFQLPITLERLMKDQAEDLNTRLTEEVNVIEKKLEKMNDATEQRHKLLDERIAAVDNSIIAMGQKMDDLVEQLAKKGKEDTQKIFDNLSAIETHLTQVLGLDCTQFKTGLDGLKTQVKETAIKGEMLHVEISAMIKASDETDTTDPSKLLVEHLRQDVQMRNSRASVALLESEFDMATGAHSAINRHIETYAAHYAKSSTANGGAYLPPNCLEKIEDLKQQATAVESFIIQGRSLVRGIKAELDAHDKELSEKYQVLGSTFATVQGLKTVNENMIILRNEVNDIKSLADAANETMSQAQSAESEKMEKAMDKMSSRVTVVEESVQKLASKPDRPPSTRRLGDAPAAAVVIDAAELSSAMGDMNEMESKLAPMIMKIVELSMGNFMRSKAPNLQASGRQGSAQTQRGSERGGAGEKRRRPKQNKDMGASFDSAASGFGSISENGAPPLLARQPSVKVFNDELGHEGDGPRSSRPQSGKPTSARRGSNANMEDLMIVGEHAAQLSRNPSAKSRITSAKSRGVSAKSKRSIKSASGDSVEHDIVDENGEKLLEPVEGANNDEEDGEDGDEYLYDEADYENEFDDNVSQPGVLNGSFADYNMGGSSNALLADIGDIRRDNLALQKRVEDLVNHRFTSTQAELLIRQIMREERRLTADKTPSAMAQDDIDKHIREIVAELIQLRKSHEYDINHLRSQFDGALVNALNAAMNEMQDSKQQSVITTKALCLGCGRPSLVNAHADRPPSPSFLPSIYANVSNGPDIYRGGFKMPVGGNSPSRETPKRRVFSVEQLGSQASLGNNLDNIPTSSAEDFGGSNVWHDVPQHSQSLVSEDEQLMQLQHHHRVGFEINDDVTASSEGLMASASMPMILSGSTAPRRETSGAHAIRHAQGRPESEQLRPIYRKGFPGKKSAKAETTFAPERFDLPGTPQSALKVSRITNVLNKPQTAPHPSHGINRPPQQLPMMLSATVNPNDLG